MKLYKNEIEVAERDDMTYYVSSYGDKFIPRVSFRPEGRRWESFKVGNEKGYKTMRGAMNAIKRDAGRKRWDAPNGYTLIGC